MKGKYIFLKLFGIISISLIIFIGAIILLQTRYFGSYYISIKENEFKTAVNLAASKFSGASGSDETLRTQLEELYTDYGCTAVLIPTDKKNVTMDNIKEIYAHGIYTEEQTDKITGIMSALLQETAKYILDDSKDLESTIKNIQSDEKSYLVATQSVIINGKPYALAMGFPLQTVDEAMKTLNSISWLAYVVAIFMSFVIAVIVAKLVARPLIREIERRKALDIMRRDFIANASHEMKTPISIISGYAESLMDGILSPEERIEYESAIYDESQKMGQLVRDMLEVAMLQNVGNQPLKEELNLSVLIHKTLIRLDQIIKEKSLVVNIEKVSSPVLVFADKRMMETVLINFITNAISHTPERGKISIILKEQDTKVYFEIENEGLPIPDDAIPHIWESFYRVDKAHNREDGNYGLGLFVVKTIIDKHQGVVGVQNKNGSVIFYFTMPKD
jgi:signal transduction histidine kinase